MSVSLTIDALVADLKPIKPINPRTGVWSTLAMLAAAAIGVFAVYGFRPDILASAPDPIVIIRGSLLVLLGLATTVATAQAARPEVGGSGNSNGWVWALAATLALPFAMIVLFTMHMISGEPFAAGAMDFSYAPHCLGISLTSALAIGVCLTLWLRRGAPTALNRAGWLVGLAAGAFGTFAYSLHCPSNSIYYVGLFYSMAVGISAAAGRLIVPRFIQW